MEDKRLCVAIVDDEPQALAATESALLLFDVVRSVEKAENIGALMEVLGRTRVDLVFLDIELGNASGFELADYIKAHFPGLPYVFLTGHADFALRGYDYAPLDFLTKPINPVRLKRVLDKVEPAGEPQEKKLGIFVKGGFQIVDLEAVTHMEKVGRKVYLHSQLAGMFEVNYTLTALEEMFGRFGFYKCHQSCIVSLRHVARIEAEGGHVYTIILTDGSTKVPLSRHKYAQLKELLSETGIHFI